MYQEVKFDVQKEAHIDLMREPSVTHQGQHCSEMPEIAVKGSNKDDRVVDADYGKLHFTDDKTVSTARRNVTRAFSSPNGISLHINEPKCDVKVVNTISKECIGISKHP